MSAVVSTNNRHGSRLGYLVRLGSPARWDQIIGTLEAMNTLFLFAGWSFIMLRHRRFHAFSMTRTRAHLAYRHPSPFTYGAWLAISPERPTAFHTNPLTINSCAVQRLRGLFVLKLLRIGRVFSLADQLHRLSEQEAISNGRPRRTLGWLRGLNLDVPRWILDLIQVKARQPIEHPDL